jgi:hypothetical protein
MKYVMQNCVTEWAYTSGKAYGDPFNDVLLDVVFSDPNGEEHIVPAFWAGDQTWRVRYSSPITGTHQYRTVCSDTANSDLHGQTGSLEVGPYQGKNPLMAHGPLRMTSGRRHLEHADGTPFFWLGDTWWMGFTTRLPWPDGFRELTADRVAKGFTLVQIVAGLYPDMAPFDERGANEAGFPWEKDLSRINPAYFDMADLKIAHLVNAGLTPCIVGSWGYFMEYAGVDMLKKHWRNLIARWGAYPVIWCIAGEALMLYYVGERGTTEREEAIKRVRAGWTEVTRAVRSGDPFRRPITIHPTQFGHEQIDDPTLLDVDMLQTGHGGYRSNGPTIDRVTEALAHTPELPVVVGEVNYEGIIEGSREEVQRFCFWASMLTGAGGHTYGANGLWQVNTREKPYGKSPHGTAWGNIPWNDAYRLPGSCQLGLAKGLLARYPWQQFESHPEWVEPHQTPADRISSYAAGIPGQVRVIYFPPELAGAKRTLKGLEAGLTYHAFLWDPKSGEQEDLGMVSGDTAGDYVVPRAPVFQDWVLVLER